MNSENKPCPICSTLCGGTISQADGDLSFYVSCPQCGWYSLPYAKRHQVENLQNDTERAALSYFIRRQSNRDRPVRFDPKSLDEWFKDNPLPSANELMNNIIVWLGDQLGYMFQQSVSFDLERNVSVFGAFHAESAIWAIKALIEESYIERTSAPAVPHLSGRLTPRGWQLYNELSKRRADSKTFFMAMPFGHAGANAAFAKFQIAVRSTGFHLVRLDKEPKAGSIDDRIRVEIRKTKLLIADLTESNAGAYFEAGFAEGLGKPVIYTCEKKYFEEKKTHFDTNHFHTVAWELSDLDDACARLKATIRNTLPEDARMED